jgi:hypothetical protein
VGYGHAKDNAARTKIFFNLIRIRYPGYAQRSESRSLHLLKIIIQEIAIITGSAEMICRHRNRRRTMPLPVAPISCDERVLVSFFDQWERVGNGAAHRACQAEGYEFAPQTLSWLPVSSGDYRARYLAPSLVWSQFAGCRVDPDGTGRDGQPWEHPWPGIAKEEQGTVFSRFYRGKESSSVSGGGLGLSLVRTICRLHDFTVDVVGGAARLRYRDYLRRGCPRAERPFRYRRG